MKHFTITALASLMASTAFSAAIYNQKRSDASDLIAAVQSWQSDTGLVSGVLNFIQDEIDATPPGAQVSTLKVDAGEALTAELNELVHKATIERILCAGDATCASVSGALAGAKAKLETGNLGNRGNFQNVVDRLMTLSETTADTFDTQDEVDGINLTRDTVDGVLEGRCEAVLLVGVGGSYCMCDVC